MKRNQINLISKVLLISILFLTPLLYTGCSANIIANYDPVAVSDIIQAYQMVDSFYQKLINTPLEQRDFASFSEDYDKIESTLRILVLKNSARTLNDESTKISKNILGLWQKYKNAHKESNSYDTDLLEIHRNRLHSALGYESPIEFKMKNNIENEKEVLLINNRRVAYLVV